VNARRAIDWLRAHPLTADALFAAVILLVTVPTLFSYSEVVGVSVRRPDLLAAVLLCAQTLPLAFRRRAPGVVLLTVGIATIAFEALHYPTDAGAVALVVMSYTVGAHVPRPRAYAMLASIVAGMLVAMLVTAYHPTVTDVFANLVVYVTGFLLGNNTRTRRAYLQELESRAEWLELEREVLARQAVVEERARIARELHDVVAHAVSVMVVQAAGAQRLVDRSPQRAADAMGEIERCGRDALGELRRLLGVLRTGDEPVVAERAPQPGLDDLTGLVERARAAGMRVELVVSGAPRPLGPAISLSCYRIVQEALTNVFKHAGPASTTVELRFGPHALELLIRDDGRGPALGEPAIRGGHGLVGMNERVALFGGTVRFGRRPGGGFEVVAQVPIPPDDVTPGLPEPRPPEHVARTAVQGTDAAPVG
jgi:signal transduction histidine kinase